MSDKNKPRNERRHNSPRTPEAEGKPSQRRPVRLKTEAYYVLGGILLLVVCLTVYALIPSKPLKDFENWFQIERLIKANQYDSALAIIDAAILSDEFTEVKDELEKKRSEISAMQRKKINAPDFKTLSTRADSLLYHLELDETERILNHALEIGDYTTQQEEKLRGKIKEAELYRNRISKGEPIKVLKSYRVKSGETLNGIAFKHEMTPSHFKAVNGMNSDMINEGQLVKVSALVEIEDYVVESGDALSVIAEKYGMSIRMLKKINGKSDNVVKVGETLKVMANADEAPSNAPLPESQDTDSIGTETETP